MINSISILLIKGSNKEESIKRIKNIQGVEKILDMFPKYQDDDILSRALLVYVNPNSDAIAAIYKMTDIIEFTKLIADKIEC